MFRPTCPTDVFIIVYYCLDSGSTGNVLALCNHRSKYIPIPKGEAAGRVSPWVHPHGCPAPGPRGGFQCRLGSRPHGIGLQTFK